jgi:heme/copper-type cytochrome/quinol oxidase subunit 2
MKFIRSSVLVFFIIMLSQCDSPQKGRTYYETKTIDSANFTIYGAGLEPKERLVVKVNNEVLFDMTASSFKGSFWKYYKYPKEISSVCQTG